MLMGWRLRYRVDAVELIEKCQRRPSLFRRLIMHSTSSKEALVVGSAEPA